MTDKAYDLTQLRELASGNDEFVESMIETFLEHTPGQLQEMLTAYDTNDLATVGAIAHKIKPNIELFGIYKITGDIRVAEDKGKKGVNDEGLKDSLMKVKTYLNEVFNQLQQR